VARQGKDKQRRTKMSMKQVKVKIKGMSALLMHQYPMTPVEALEKKPIPEQAEHAAYRDSHTGELYVPGIAVQRAFVNGATFSKGKGRATLQKPVAACVLVTPERIPLGVDEFVIDTRPVVIPSTKGRVLRHRPRLNSWEIEFMLEYDDTLLTEEQMRRIVDDTGTRVGILDFRPEKKGPFGRFCVSLWEMQ
jgi:hypothetical protein